MRTNEYAIGKHKVGEQPRKVRLWLREGSDGSVELCAGLADQTRYDSCLLIIDVAGNVTRVGRVGGELGLVLDPDGQVTYKVT